MFLRKSKLFVPINILFFLTEKRRTLSLVKNNCYVWNIRRYPWWIRWNKKILFCSLICRGWIIGTELELGGEDGWFEGMLDSRMGVKSNILRSKNIYHKEIVVIQMGVGSRNLTSCPTSCPGFCLLSPSSSSKASHSSFSLMAQYSSKLNSSSWSSDQVFLS